MDYDFEFRDYIQAVNAATTREELVAATRLLEKVGVEANAQAEAMTDEDFQRFHLGLPEEREGRSMARPDFGYERFGHILLPLRALPIFSLAKKYQVPFGVAYNQLDRMGYEFSIQDFSVKLEKEPEDGR